MLECEYSRQCCSSASWGGGWGGLRATCWRRAGRAAPRASPPGLHQHGASQSTHYLRSDRLTYAGLGVARRGGEEAGDVDVVLVVAVVVGVDLLAELAELPRPGLVSPRPATHQQQGDQPQPHGHQVALGSPMVTTRQH